MATVMTTALPLAAASVVVANPIAIGIDIAGTIGRRSGGVSMMGAGTITDAITRAAVIADAIAVGIDVTGAVVTIARTMVVADAIAIGINVTPPGDGLHGRVSCYDSLPRGQVSHAKRESRHGKNGA